MINSNSAKRFCSFLLCISITLGLLLGSSVVAYADDTVTIGGVVCTPITLTNQDIKNMFDNGDITAFFRLSASTSANISLFNMESAETSVTTIGTNYTQFNADRCEIFIVSGNDNRLYFSAPYSYNLRVNASSTLMTQFIIDMPFPYYIQDYSVFHAMYYSGLSADQNTSCTLTFDSNGTNNYNVTKSGNYLTTYWYTHSGLKSWYNFYNNAPAGLSFNTIENEGLRTHYSNYTFSGLSDDRLFSSFRANDYVNVVHADGTGWDYIFYAPMVSIWDFGGTVYVPVDESELISEYLSLIAGDPTAENQARIDELVNEFQTKEQELSDLAEDLTVNVPDTSGAISGLPAEAQDGANDFATYIFTPIYNIPIVGILVACAFGFAVIKLLLYGSGSA